MDAPPEAEREVEQWLEPVRISCSSVDQHDRRGCAPGAVLVEEAVHEGTGQSALWRIQPDSSLPDLRQAILVLVVEDRRLDRFIGLFTGRGVYVERTENFACGFNNMRRCEPLIM